MVALDNGKIMILGGSRSPRSQNFRDVLIFDPKDNTFTPGPTLLFEREDAGCTLFHRFVKTAEINQLNEFCNHF